MDNEIATLSGMAGLSGAYSRVEQEDKFTYGIGRPFLPDEYSMFVSQFDRIEKNSKKDYDGEHPWLPITVRDLSVRLTLGEDLMHWVLGQDDLGNEVWFHGEEKTMLFLRGSLVEVFQPENNLVHGILCLEQAGHDYSIMKEGKNYRVTIASKWLGTHPVSREKAIVNAILHMIGKREQGYIVEGKGSQPADVEKKTDEVSDWRPMLKGMSTPFCRR